MGKKKRSPKGNQHQQQPYQNQNKQQQKQKQNQQGKRKRELGPAATSSSNNGKSGRTNNSKWKRPRRERYWIEDCPETSSAASQNDAAALTLLITRVELQDQHTYTNAATDKPSGDADSLEGNLNAVKNDDFDDDDDVGEVEAKKKAADAEAKKTDTEAKCAPTETNNPNSSETSAAACLGEPCDQIEEEPQSTTPVASRSKDDAEDKDDTTGANVSNNKAETPNALVTGTICIRRDASAKKKPKKFNNDKNFRHLPNGDCGDGVKNPYPKNVVADKYWAQRHRLFSRFDQGIKLDKESWYSVTPEAIAHHIANKMVQRLTSKTATTTTASAKCSDMEELVIVDAFCGAGGNAVAFAQQPAVSLVICVDMDESKLRLAAHNAKVYDIPDSKLLFIHADACHVLCQYSNGLRRQKPDSSDRIQPADDKNVASAKLVEHAHGYRVGGLELLPETISGIFLSPPWGGMDYGDIGARMFDLKCVRFDNGLNGEKVLEYSASAISSDEGCMACFLPRNTNGAEVGKSALVAGISGVLELEQNMLNDKFKAITIYSGPKQHGGLWPPHSKQG